VEIYGKYTKNEERKGFVRSGNNDDTGRFGAADRLRGGC
jgi:hypothetical protein